MFAFLHVCLLCSTFYQYRPTAARLNSITVENRLVPLFPRVILQYHCHHVRLRISYRSHSFPSHVCNHIPVATYYRDPKGLRKYPNLNALCALSDLGFIWEANKPFRSNPLLKTHMFLPVVQIGPNSLSFSDPSAIKVRIY